MLHRIVFIVKLIDMELVKILFCLRALIKKTIDKSFTYDIIRLVQKL